MKNQKNSTVFLVRTVSGGFSIVFLVFLFFWGEFITVQGAESASRKVRKIQVVGLSNDWSVGGAYGQMKNLGDNQWETFLHISSGTHYCYFVADDSWSYFWGSASQGPHADLTGSVVLKGNKIQLPFPNSNTYKVTFNANTGEFSFAQQWGTIPPVAKAGPDQTVSEGTIVHFTAAGSYDPDGTIASYSWSNGLTGTSPYLLYDTEGVYEVTLTVTDDTELEGTDSVTITVIRELPLDPDFRSQTIYSLIPSRFYNGDTENDFYCREHIVKGDPHWRGDFKGLIEKLDHIKSLGFTTICITPPTETRGSFDFDGATPYDWLKIDPRLESAVASYPDFLVAAHAKGLRVIQTVILNHCSNYGIRNQIWIDRLPHKFYRAAGVTFPWPYEVNWGNYRHPFRMDNDNPRAPEWFQDWLKRDPLGNGPFIDPKTGTTLPQEGFDPNRFFGTNETELDQYWFHKNGWINASDTVATATLHDKHIAVEAIDLATENMLVRDYLNEAVIQYINWGVDGIRINFAGNMPRQDILPMVNYWKEGHPQLFVFCDVFGSGSGLGQLGTETFPSELAPWYYTRTGNDPLNPDSGVDSKMGVMDYTLLRSFSTTISAGHLLGLGKILAWDWIYGDPTSLVTFFHNHNIGPDTDDSKRFNSDQWKAALAYNIIWTIRGIPCLYFGEETEFKKGATLRTAFSPTPLNLSGKAYYGDTVSSPDTSGHPIVKHLQRLNFIRARVPALQKGKMLQGKEWVTGMSFVRDYNNGESYAAVGISAFIDQDITVENVRVGVYRDAITGNEVSVASDSRNLTFSVKGNSMGIYILNGRGKLGQDGTYLR